MQLNNKKKSIRGFTLLELLVVVAIIAILASIVFVSLGNARAKSVDSLIQQNLKTIQTQAEIYFQNHKTYTINYPPTDPYGDNFAAGVTCSTAALYYNLFNRDPIIKKAIQDTMRKINNTNPPYTSFCGSSRNSWVAAIRLKTSPRNDDSTDRLWCVDSSGKSKEISGPPIQSELSDGNYPPTFRCP